MASVKKNYIFFYLVILLVAFIAFVLYHSTWVYPVASVISPSIGTFSTYIMVPSETVGGVSTQYLPEVAIDVYGPPLRNEFSPIIVDDCNGYPRNSTDVRGSIQMENMCIQENPFVPIQIQTRGIPREFTQLGILKNDTESVHNKVLSLFGRQLMVSGDKWQYYTLYNTGIMPTRLPIHVKQNGKWKEAMCEYGVDRLYSEDVVLVDGLNEQYLVQIYDTRQYRYIG